MNPFIPRTLLFLWVFMLLIVGVNELGFTQSTTTMSESDTASEAQSPIDDALALVYDLDNVESSLFFWKMESEKATFYFCGTLHFGDEDFYPLDSRILDAFDASDYLVVEVNIEEINQAEMIQLVRQECFYEPPDTLQNHLSTESLTFLEEHLQENNLSFSMFAQMKVWMVPLVLSSMTYQGRRLNSELGIDRYFIQRALDQDKPIREFETAMEQISFFNDLTDEVQEAWMIQQLHLSDQESSDLLDNMIAAWETGDTDSMAKLLLGSSDLSAADHDLYGSLLYERNVNWVEKIRLYMEEGGTYFIAVGAGHFSGGGSVIHLLEEEGYVLIQY